MKILGVNFFGHDSAIFEIDFKKKKIFAISTERITGIKHDNIDVSYIFEKHRVDKIDFIAQSNSSFDSSSKYDSDINSLYLRDVLRKIIKPKFRKDLNISYSERRIKLLKSAISNPIVFLSFLYIKIKILNKKILKFLFNIPIMMKTNDVKKFILKRSRKFGLNPKNVNFYDHHLCHASSAYYFSPFAFKDLAVSFSIDGYGDLKFSTAYLFNGNDYKLISESKTNFFSINDRKYICSIGFIYSNFTEALGFIPNSDEGKTEALAAFGSIDNNLYKDLKKTITVSAKGIVFNVENTKKFYDLGYLKNTLENIGRENFACTLQNWLEDVVVSYLNKVYEECNCQNLCLSGGVSANIIMNLNIYEKTKFKNIYIFPAMGDDGVSSGAAILKALEEKQDISWLNKYEMPYFGTEIHENDVVEFCKNDNRVIYTNLKDGVCKHVAVSLKKKCIVAIVNGKMEFGPRALGNRSILAECTDPNIRQLINQKIKNRPSFQPFCPSILEEDREELFENSFYHKHMAIAFRMRKKYQNQYPSATHIDGTCRPQFVKKKDNENFFHILKEYKKLNDHGILINTSFNKHGRTIVNTVERAIEDFIDCNIDKLYIGNYLIEKKVNNR
jgi:carbamoyltransferase